MIGRIHHHRFTAIGILIFICLLSIPTLSAQNMSSQGISYQAVARDASGQILVKQNIALKVSLSSKEANQTRHYSEIHELTTDALGYFQIVIGRGKTVKGGINEVPWAREQIWLNIELDPLGGRAFTLVNSSELMSVPYAFHAATAAQLLENATEINLPTEKNQSIYWTTGGNTNTRPPIHFLGTKDNRDLVFKTDNTTRMTITGDGLIKTYSSCVDNGDQDTASYSIVAQGCKQGIYIKINGQRSGDNNFVTFADEEDIWGRIEGETFGEMITSFDYLFTNAGFAIKTASIALNLTGLVAEAAVVAAQILTIVEAAPILLQAKAIDAQFGFTLIEWAGYNIEKAVTVGVTYESGAGDYAEWLERIEGERDLKPGEVVGVRGGKISLNTQNAEHFMVVSSRPVVLGNMPQKNREHRYEKTAFMGQVLVRVVGKVNVGDYILPSGNNDGLAVAIAPAKMKPGDYKRIIGTAWQAAKDAPINLVNVAVGINKNDVAPAVEEFQQQLNQTNQKVDNILAFLEGRTSSLADTVSAFNHKGNIPEATAESTFQKLFSDEAFDQIIDENAVFLKTYYARMEKQLLDKGYDLNKQPYLQAYLQNPIELIKQLRRNPAYTTHWNGFDQNLMPKK